MSQLSLDDHGVIGPTRNALEEKYRRWLCDHPTVFALFEKFALDMLAKQRRFGVKALAERVRWEVQTTWGSDASGYRFNNNYTAYIARDLIALHPGLKALVECREVQGEES